ncbi:MAG: EAL domain-containing protein [Thermoanaerobaculia bacterium]|jgi:diguanylate cyclase (GGDEF)-like protein/PAS domain S-box-containing protein
MTREDDSFGDLTIRTQISRFIEAAPPPVVQRLPAIDQEYTEKLVASGFSVEQIRFLDSAVQYAPEGIVVMAPREDGSPKVVFVNDGYCRMSGRPREEIIGQGPAIFASPESDKAMADALLHPLCQRRGFSGEALATRANGARYILDLTVVPAHDADGALIYWIAYMHDVSEKKAQLAALEHQVLHDVLTDLPNRALLEDRLQQAMLAAEADRMSVGLVFFDLDDFREVNDTLGHHFGDAVLRQVAARVQPALRPVDTVSRLGGDEFAILLPNIVDTRDAMKIALAVYEAFLVPFDIEGQTFEVGASVGVAVSPTHSNDAVGLMRCAEVAMYAAKNSRNGYLPYAPDQETATITSLALRVDLREAIEHNQLVLYYQPKIHLRSGLVTRVEALVRWLHPERGLMQPDQFIPLAERSALIKQLTDWVLDGALAQCRAWQEAGFPLHVAVNLPTQSLLEPFLPQRVSRLLDKWGLDPRVLKLEITESGIMADPPHVLAILHLLRTLGVRLSLDDFGTGYSSLVHMRHLPVDEIKIDKSFIMGMRHNESDGAIVRTIISLAHSLGHEVVAEGVDDEETFKILSELGCDLAQGYYLTPPLPADELMKWLEKSRWGEGATEVLRKGKTTH